MLNLLPQEQKQVLLSEEKFKIILVLGIITLFFLLSFILILISIKIFLSAEMTVQKINFEQKEKELEDAAFREIENKIASANAIFSELASFYRGQRNSIVVLEKISNVLPSGIYLNNLNFNLASSQIFLVGFSPSREILLELKENLEKETSFSAVYFPPTDWLEPVNINFSLNFKIR
ncbi:MAG: PilN domain-containing protein [Candidatus Nealsonbacteria bacterium]|nr:PilN domain-containing protein [Candidatus Nealsonbacteria bacterium]